MNVGDYTQPVVSTRAPHAGSDTRWEASLT